MRAPTLSYANLMSTVAVFIALGGTSYAVTKLPKGSVGERELRAGAVTGEKVKDASLSAIDLAPGTLLTGPRGPRGTEGPAGAIGPVGAVGQTGPSDILFQPHGGAALSKDASTWSPTAKLVNVPAGNWLFTGTAALVFGGPGADWFHCRLQFGSQDGTSASTVRLGVGYEDYGAAPSPADASNPPHRWIDDATAASTVVVQEGFRTTGPTTVTLRCAHQGAIVSGDTPRTDYATLSAIRTENLQIQ